MAGRLKKDHATRRDRLDAARLKRAGDPAHINAREDRLLRRELPESHGAVVTRGLLAEAGRRGDDRVTQINTREAALLRARGGSGTVNPATGLLEYNNSGDQDDGQSSNTSSAGENTGGMSGAPGSGVAGPEGSGTGRGDGPGVDGLGAAYSGPYGAVAGQLGYRAYDAMKQPAIESLLAAPNFAMPGMRLDQYAQRDTLSRLVQEYMRPSLSVPGRLSAPNARGPGIMGSFVSQLAGGPFSGLMGLGGAMGRASSAATQAASAKEDAERSAHNSTGQQQSHSLLDMDAKLAEAAGTQSGAATADLVAPPGYTVNPAGQIVPLPGADRERGGLPRPVENLLADYIWRGRQGSALGGWGW